VKTCRAAGAFPWLAWLRTACGQARPVPGSRFRVPGDSAVAAHPHYREPAQADFVKMRILVITHGPNLEP
jgi:hypothetical protein